MQPSKDKALMDRLNAIMDRFALSAPESSRTLTELWNAQNFRGLERKLHQIKGTAANCGYENIAEVASQLEEELRGNASKEKISQYLDQIQDYSEKACSGVSARTASSRDAVSN